MKNVICGLLFLLLAPMYSALYGVGDGFSKFYFPRYNYGAPEQAANREVSQIRFNHQQNSTNSFYGEVGFYKVNGLIHDHIGDRKFNIINETNRPLFYSFSSDGIEDCFNPYFHPFMENMSSSDTTWWIESECFIKPYGTRDLQILFDSQIYIFIFEADTLKKYDWEDVKKNNRYFRKYRFTVEDLQELDWKVRITEESENN